MQLSKKSKIARTPVSTQKIVHISRAKRPFDAAAKTEPAQYVKSLYAEVSNDRLPLLVDSSIRADMYDGDYGLLVLRKVNFVLRHLSNVYGTRPDVEILKREMIHRMVWIIRDYGDPNGIPLLNDALIKGKNHPDIRQSVSVAIARIGLEEHLNMLCAQLSANPDSPLHLQSLEHFSERFPNLRQDIATSIRISSTNRDALLIADSLDRRST